MAWPMLLDLLRWFPIMILQLPKFSEWLIMYYFDYLNEMIMDLDLYHWIARMMVLEFWIDCDQKVWLWWKFYSIYHLSDDIYDIKKVPILLVICRILRKIIIAIPKWLLRRHVPNRTYCNIKFLRWSANYVYLVIFLILCSKGYWQF